MYREIINDLKQWKDKSRRKPLLLTGVRQCGKTYIVNEFAKECFPQMRITVTDADSKLTTERMRPTNNSSLRSSQS